MGQWVNLPLCTVTGMHHRDMHAGTPILVKALQHKPDLGPGNLPRCLASHTSWYECMIAKTSLVHGAFLIRCVVGGGCGAAMVGGG